MSAKWIEIGLWICRILRVLLISRCLISCFTTWESKVYKVFYYITLPFTFFLTLPIQSVSKKKKLFFDIDAMLIYILVLYINCLIIDTKMAAGLF